MRAGAEPPIPPIALAAPGPGGTGRPRPWVVAAIATIAGVLALVAAASARFAVARCRVRPLPVRPAAVAGLLGAGRARSPLAGGIRATRDGILALEERGGWVDALRPAREPAPRWKVSGDGRTDLVEPADVAVGADGRIYVLDAGTGFLSTYGPDGRPLGRALGPEAGVYRPRGVAVAGDGTVFVADTGTSRVLRVGADGAVAVIAGREGDGGGLREPIGIRCDAAGALFVADSGNGRIKKLGPDGRTAAEWKLPGNPAYLALDARGRIFASSPSSGCVFAVRLADGAVARVTGPDRETAPFGRPVGVDVAGERLYVADGWEIRVYEPASR